MTTRSTKHLKERQHFHALKLGNPNYFGNLKDSTFVAAMKIASDTNFEELLCVGYQPQFGRLEAVVQVKQPGGYNGALCERGSPEYVRFYLSFDGGSSWIDQGMTSFVAHDGGGSQPVDYDVTLEISPPAPGCGEPTLPMVRAILSWNDPPTPSTPGFTPTWGNVVDAHIQLQPSDIIIPLFELEKVKVAPATLAKLGESLDLSQPVAAPVKGAASLTDLHAAYQGKVPGHRMLFPSLSKMATHAPHPQQLAASAEYLAKIGIDVIKAVGDLVATEADVSFEQLRCVGYNLAAAQLVATLTVKKSAGYSGDLCHDGSQEYVNFWVDFGSGWTLVGTTSVTVHDVPVPTDGLQYSVFLPWNPVDHQRPCGSGLNTARVRAVLSWSSPPSMTNPDALSTWGNRVDALVQLRPGDPVTTGSHAPIIDTVGGMSPLDIDSNGIADGPSTLPASGFTAVDSPFGGNIEMTGHIAYPGTSVGSLLYRVRVTPDAGTPQTLNNTFSLTVRQLVGGVWQPQTVIPQTATLVTDSVAGVTDYFYPYQEFTSGSTQQFVTGNVLSEWGTSGLSGRHTITIDVLDPVTHALFPLAAPIAVMVNNLTPQAPMLEITSGGGNCGDFQIGDVVYGTYTAVEPYFGGLTIDRLPVPPSGGVYHLLATGTSPPPPPSSAQQASTLAATPAAASLSRAYSHLPTSTSAIGEAGFFALETAGLPRCGYVLELWMSDRTIWNSVQVGVSQRATVGLCLRDPGT